MLRTEKITALLAPLAPSFLEIKDDSHKHAGHNAEAKAGGTHIRLKIISEKFAEKSRIERHRMVQKLLLPEFETGLHALQIEAQTLAESSR